MLTNQEIKTFFSVKGIDDTASVRHEGRPTPVDFRYGCHGIFHGDALRIKMTRALRLADDEIFSEGATGMTLSWSSRSGYAMFNLTSNAEDIIRQMVYEYNAEKMLDLAE